MRHQVRGRKLGRTSSHRKATLEALSNALIRNERITTTLPKAKELRKFVEPLITRSKEDNLLNRRIVFAALRDKETVKKIFEEVGPLVADRPGGYTRIVKVGNRSGDGAPVAIIELVDYNDAKPETAGKKKKRTRRGSGKAKDETPTTAGKQAKDKAEPKKPAGETAAAPEVKAEEAAPVAEKTADPVQEVKAEETAEKATEVEAKAVEPEETADDATTAGTESAAETAANDTVENPKSESATAETDTADVVEKKADAGDEAGAKAKDGSESEDSSDDDKKEEDKGKKDK